MACYGGTNSLLALDTFKIKSNLILFGPEQLCHIHSCIQRLDSSKTRRIKATRCLSLQLTSK